MRLSTPITTAWLTTLLVACGSEPLAGEQLEPAVCVEPAGFGSSPEPQFVGSVSGTVRDEQDSAPPGLLVQVCGLDLCISGETDDSGAAVVAVASEMKLPAFKYGNGITHAKIALLLPEATDDVELGVVHTAALPASGPSITPGEVARSGGVELSVAKSASVVFDRLTYRTEEEQQFRAAELPLSLAPDGLGRDLGFEQYFALAPADTELCPPAALTLPNTAGFSPGAEVELYLHGLDIEERHAPYGGFSQFADGVVSDDGESIHSTTGIPILSLVAVRLKP